MVGIKQELGPYQAVPFTWDEPSKFRRLVIEIDGEVLKKEINLDIIKAHTLDEVSTLVALQSV
jgi:hypothetical protein